jgi:uncharacterized protein GlcG (DUF336 family)
VIRRGFVSLLAGLSLLVASCGGGGSGGGTSGSSGGTGSSSGGTTTTSPFTVPAAEALSVADVQQIVAQGVAQAQADGKPAVISVVDRVGNVLALFRMTGAPATTHITDAPNGANLDFQGLDVPAETAAIAKALTGAYLSSGGNAFSSRTASEIVQTQFPPSPGTVGLGSGPLYGVQFSQLPCSDLSQRFGAGGAAAMIGPKRSPLGLSADPGGFPLYKNGVVVGGVGVEADGVYGFDGNVNANNLVTDERIALAGTVGFAAPASILASTITVAGTLLIYANVDPAALAPLTGVSWATASGKGALVALTGYTDGTLIAGTAYGTEASGVRAATAAEFASAGAFVLSDGAGNDRYPVRGGSDGGVVTSPLTATEVRAILAQAFGVMSQARAQIRNPLNSLAQVSISVVDTSGTVLGLVRSPDAPLFGIDVSLQKARTAAFFSNAVAASDLTGNASPRVASYVGAARTFLNNPTALTGTYAFTDRAGGDLSRPTFPDGSVGRPNGPFSVPEAQFNPFATGLQSALVVGDVANHLAYVTGAAASDVPHRCTATPASAPGQNRIQNGIQIFPGSVPVYRGNTLVGGVGVSGDGIDQDDMISFLGLAQAGQAVGSIGHAPAAIRADQIVVRLSDGTTANLRYVSCPQSPFVNSSAQNVCQGL